MIKYYIYQSDDEGVYRVSKTDRGSSLCTFYSDGEDNSSILQEADKQMSLEGKLNSYIQTTYIFDS